MQIQPKTNKSTCPELDYMFALYLTHYTKGGNSPCFCSLDKALAMQTARAPFLKVEVLLLNRKRHQGRKRRALRVRSAFWHTMESR